MYLKLAAFRQNYKLSWSQTPLSRGPRAPLPPLPGAGGLQRSSAGSSQPPRWGTPGTGPAATHRDTDSGTGRASPGNTRHGSCCHTQRCRQRHGVSIALAAPGGAEHQRTPAACTPFRSWSTRSPAKLNHTGPTFTRSSHPAGRADSAMHRPPQPRQFMAKQPPQHRQSGSRAKPAPSPAGGWFIQKAPKARNNLPHTGSFLFLVRNSHPTCQEL